MKKLLFAPALILASVVSSQAAVITLVNGDFEANTTDLQTAGLAKLRDGFSGKTPGSTPNDKGINVTGWTNLAGGGGYGDSGIETNSGNAGNGMSAFINAADLNTGAYQVVQNLSSYTDLGVGSILTLTFDAAPTSNGALNKAMDVRIFSTADSGSTQNTLVAYTGALSGTNNSWVRGLTASYTLTAADVGKDIGISFRSGATGGYAGFDNFALSYTPIPEPSTYGIAGGVLALVAGVAARRYRKK